MMNTSEVKYTITKESRFKIVKNVALPPTRNRGSSFEDLYLVLNDMEVGDMIPLGTDKKAADSAYNAAGRWGEKNNKSFTRRLQANKEFGLWRIK